MRLGKVAGLLACSGACALVYQVAWFRELRLVFGASTAASSAVLAVFMGGLGFGGAWLGKRADEAKNPLALYANLEIAVACFAAATPFLVMAANGIYCAIGGTLAVGSVVATMLRILLSVIVLGPTTFLMGGTLPAAASAVERSDDTARRRLAVLYGVNTFGAVVGALLANFLLLEVLGTRATLWSAALVNVLVGLAGRALARGATRPETRPETIVEGDAAPATTARWFPPAAAALAGTAFLLMELVWYRMLGPLIGGSSYTFGLILAVGLAGIGIGGALYARSAKGATLRAFAVTCSLEALFVVLPYAAGDRFALAVAIARPFCRIGFGTSVALWSVVAVLAVLPVAIVSGYQFPLIVGLYGRGSQAVGRDLGAAYLANTLGAIGGSLVGGFVLVPQLGAVTCWKLVALALVVGSVVALGLDRGQSRLRIASASLPAFLVLLLVFGARGPTAIWRHSGIGAGRADSYLEPVDARSIAVFENHWARGILWEAEGVESSVALGYREGYNFSVNGKSDGSALGDAPTQVMGGLVPALLHPDPHAALVVGLGTGSTAGWLGQVPAIDRVDVVELEPSIVRVARDCAAVNANVLDNPKVHIALADAREILRTTRRRYDLIFSEPSNPYRAGISSLYTVEFYRAAAERLEDGGLFVQWLQSYEVDAWAVATALTTLHDVFPDVTLWETMQGDFLLVGRRAHAPIAMSRLRERVAAEPYRTALRNAWRTDTAEGVLGHVVADAGLADVIARNHAGAINRDDQNLLEFAFARTVGIDRRSAPDFVALAERLGVAKPDVDGAVDWNRVIEERWLFQAARGVEFSPPLLARPDLGLAGILDAYRSGHYREARSAWQGLGREARTFGETALVADIVGQAGAPEDAALIEHATIPGERAIARAFFLAHTGKAAAAADALVQAFVVLRTDAWARRQSVTAALSLALDLGRGDAKVAHALQDALKEPFALELVREDRLVASTRLAFLAHDLPACLASLVPLDPPPPDRTILEARVACFTKANDPRAQSAQEALRVFDEASAPFGATLQRR